jgi:predicted ATPase/DNA-binding CsgD family transcriptional regulator
MLTQGIQLHNLPSQPTPFIGREPEIAEIVGLLNDANCRLLTLLGLGGIGKTRLAIEVARRFIENDGTAKLLFPDGVFFIPLASLVSPNSIVPTIANILDFHFYKDTPIREQLLDYLRARRLLLVIDNFEHLLDGSDLLTEILESASGVQILVTSREALNIQFEWRREVFGLDVPNGEQIHNSEAYSAVQLFIQRTQQMRKDLDLHTEQEAITKICRLVAGVPLALELAATWIKTLNCGAIANEIQVNVDFLATRMQDLPERHRSIRAIFNHSWGLLTNDEQTVLRTLSVFRGGFTRAAAEQIAGASLTILANLIDKSFIRLDPSQRYYVHELVRQYAQEQLAVANTIDTTANQHMLYYADFLKERAVDIKGRRQLEGLNDVEADFENIRSAWNRAVVQGNADTLDRMIEGLTLFCELRAHYQQGEILFQEAYDRLISHTDSVPSLILNRLHARRLHMNILQLKALHTMQDELEALLDTAQQDTNIEELAFCQRVLGDVYHYFDNKYQALQYFTSAHDNYKTLGDSYYLGRTLRGIAFCYLGMGTEYQDKFKAINQQYLNVTREIGDKSGMAHAIYYEGYHHIFVTGNYTEAMYHMREGGALWEEMGDSKSVGITKSSLGHVFVFLGQFEQAKLLAEEGIKISDKFNHLTVKQISLFVLGTVACIEENYLIGRQHYANIQLDSSEDPNLLAEWGFALVACGLADYQQAQQHIHQVMEFWLTLGGTQTTVWLLVSLPIATLILANQGEPIWAIELLGLAFNHPNQLTGWAEKWSLLTQLRYDLEAELGSDTFNNAWERGHSLDLITEVKKLLLYLKPEDHRSFVANQALIEPLTRRELEVLRLLADRRSNREIADELTVVVGTVKSHVHNICQKLSAHNRHQAVAHARTLNLL